MSTEEKYELFEDYLNDTLSDIQKADFERQIQQDEVLYNELAVFKEMRNVISSRLAWEASHKPFVQTLESLTKEHFKSGKEARVVSLSRRRLLQVLSAAAVILLVVLVWQPWQKDMYSHFAQHPRAELTARDGSGTLSIGSGAFNNKEYAAALEAFTQHLVDHPDDIDAIFYQGICYLELGKLEEAQNNFRQLFIKTQPYRDMGSWYLGMTFLKQHNTDSTAWYLNQIGVSSEYYNKANQLLKKL